MKSQSIVSLDDAEQARCVCNRVLAQREAGINHMAAQRGRFITPTMLEQYEACFWGNAETPHSRKPIRDTVRTTVREQTRNAWK